MAFELTYRPLENGKNQIYFRRGIINNTLLVPEKEIGCYLVIQS